MKNFRLNKLLAAESRRSFLFQWCLSYFPLLKKIESRFCASLPAAALGIIVLLLGTAFPAHGAEKFCSDPPYYGVIDGNRHPAPTQISIDMDCTFKNFPQSRPLTTTVNFHTNDPTIYLIIFDNVYFTGHMACANVEHRIWFSNSSDYGSSNACQDLFIPVEAIDKQNPVDQTTAAIGVPFTYTLTLPSMYGDPSVNDLHSVVLKDDLTKNNLAGDGTAVDLEFLGINAYYKSTNTPVTLIKVENPDDSEYLEGCVWAPPNLCYKFPEEPPPAIRAGEQIVVEITVVLLDTPRNVPGTQFTNTAKWSFGRLIDNVYYQPLPGDDGQTQPMTIVGPDLVVTKTGPSTIVNLGEWAEFTIDVWNSGSSDAWHVDLRDQLPSESSSNFSGGMCDMTPDVIGVALAGSPLTQGSDYDLSYTGCELRLTLLEPAGPVGPDEHLVITYRTKVDPDPYTESGAVLTNVAAASWSNDQDINAGQTYTCAVTDGTEGTSDCQDAHSLLVVLSGYFFEKIATNPDTGEVVTTAMAGETLRYRLRLWNIDQAFDALRFYDDLGVLNNLPSFVPGSLTLVSYPVGADISNTNPTGGTNNAGILDIRNLSVGTEEEDEIKVLFDITLAADLPEGHVVKNQAELFSRDLQTSEYTIKVADSDDPNINGQADPAEPDDENPTEVVIYFPQPPPPLKEALRTTATIGEEVSYRITVPGELSSRPLYNVVITDVLDGNLEYLGFTQLSGPTVTDNSAAQNLNFSIAQNPAGQQVIPAGQQVVIDVRARVKNVIEAQQGIVVNNSAFYTYANSPSEEPRPRLTSETVSLNIVEPHIEEIIKSANASTPTAGQIVRYSITLTASNTTYSSDVFDVTLVDNLGLGLAYAGDPAVTSGTGVGSDNTIGEPVITGDGINQEQTLSWSLSNDNVDIDITKGTSVTISYNVLVLDSVLANQSLTNSAVAQWTGIDGLNANERTGTDGIGELNDYVTAPATFTVQVSLLTAQKSVENLTTSQSGANASPNDRLRYTITIENTSDIPVNNFQLVDDIDVLNGSPMFQPDSIANVTIPNGADYVINGSRLTVNSLNIGAYGIVTVSFEAVLAPVIDSGTIVLNQGELTLGGVVFTRTDDPNITGPENPTETLISSATLFEVQKTSTILDGDPDILMAGETLQYTITVRNIGNENAVNVSLRDNTPAHTSYVANSTTLNGIAVPDPAPGVNPLQAGIPVNTPGTTTSGDVLADMTPGAVPAATIVFRVMVEPDVMDGLIIENQGFLSSSGAGSGPQPDQPSDDPNTPIPDDPTRNIVGNLPLLYAQKTVEKLKIDQNEPDTVSPGDTLLYTIVILNLGTIPATDVVLSDNVPPNTSYVENTLDLNETLLGPDNGVFPLITGLPVQSADNPGSGIISAGESATVTFEVLVNPGVPEGTIISNQGTLTSSELDPDLTDADGVPSNGRQPTVIVVGDVQLLTITKEVLVVGGGAALPGSELEYVIRVSNISTLPATGVLVTDDLDPDVVPVDDPLNYLGGQVTYVDGSGSMNGSPAGVTFVGAILTADFGGQYGDLPPGATLTVRFRVQIDATLASGTTIINQGVVEWNGQSDFARASIDVGATPGSASLNGYVWHDANLDWQLDSNELPFEGWSVELYRNSQLVATVVTDAAGAYHFNNLLPNAGTSNVYELRFRAPNAGPNTASMGEGHSPHPFTYGPQRISNIVAQAGTNLQDLNLPLWPNGIVYNSVARVPVAGARVALLNATTGAPLPSQCFNDPAQQNQVTVLNGFYKFDLNFSDASCPAGTTYLIEVTPPTTGYLDAPSLIIPPASDANTAPFSIPGCPNSPDDAVPAVNDYCEVVASALVPPPSVLPGTAGTMYHLHLLLADGSTPVDGSTPGESQIFNNFIPIDPELDGAVAISKTSSMTEVNRGALVPYTITVNNVYGAPLYDISIVDLFPAGFKYVAGSARIGGNPVEPMVNGQQLVWEGLELQFNQEYTIKLLLVAGSGVSEGEYVNRAQVLYPATGRAISEEAAATVRVVADPDFDCTDVVGKVFDDVNLNGHQETDEQGLHGVRLVTARGLIATSDKYGRFHITCAVVPDEDRGSNFILKLDERSLPTGYRVTTENPRVQRATRGKMLRFNFGATIHRVVRIDIADGVFEPESTELRPQWLSKMNQLIEELSKKPSLLRLSYLGDIEAEGLVQERLEVLKKEIASQWKHSDGSYQLDIETEIFWRRGAPLQGQR